MTRDTLPTQLKRDVQVWADELRGILRASAAFDRGSRVYLLVNALESNAASYQREAEDLRAIVGKIDQPYLARIMAAVKAEEDER